jgi:hypothetical protein
VAGLFFSPASGINLYNRFVRFVLGLFQVINVNNCNVGLPRLTDGLTLWLPSTIPRVFLRGVLMKLVLQTSLRWRRYVWQRRRWPPGSCGPRTALPVWSCHAAQGSMLPRLLMRPLFSFHLADVGLRLPVPVQVCMGALVQEDVKRLAGDRARCLDVARIGSSGIGSCILPERSSWRLR